MRFGFGISLLAARRSAGRRTPGRRGRPSDGCRRSRRAPRRSVGAGLGDAAEGALADLLGWRPSRRCADAAGSRPDGSGRTSAASRGRRSSLGVPAESETCGAAAADAASACVALSGSASAAAISVAVAAVATRVLLKDFLQSWGAAYAPEDPRLTTPDRGAESPTGWKRQLTCPGGTSGRGRPIVVLSDRYSEYRGYDCRTTRHLAVAEPDRSPSTKVVAWPAAELARDTLPDQDRAVGGARGPSRPAPRRARPGTGRGSWTATCPSERSGTRWRTGSPGAARAVDRPARGLRRGTLSPVSKLTRQRDSGQRRPPRGSRSARRSSGGLRPARRVRARGCGRLAAGAGGSGTSG